MGILIECLLEFIISFGIWFAIVYFINYLINKRKIEKKKNIRIILAISLVIAALSILPTFTANTQPQNTEANITSDIMPVDKTRLNEIITQVIQDPNPISVENHKVFWSLMEKYNLSSKDINTFKDQMTGVSTKYMKYFYEDALIALKNGSTYKSSLRDDYEKYLTDIGVDEATFIRNDAIIGKIANKETMDVQGTSVILTEDIIKKILKNVDTISARIDELFTRP